MSRSMLWVIVALAAGILEIVVPAFGFVFVTLAALLAALLALVGVGTSVQVVVFAAATLFFLLVLRPLFVRRLGGPGVPSRTDALLGLLAEVTEPIDPVRGSGRIIVAGHDWAARAAMPLAAGTRVKVEGADGIVLIVSPRVVGGPHAAAAVALLLPAWSSRPLRAHRARQVDQGRPAEAGQADRAGRQVPQEGRRGPERHRSVPRLGARRRSTCASRSRRSSRSPSSRATTSRWKVDAVIYYVIADPVRSTYEVQNLLWGIEQLTLSSLRNVIGALDLDHTLTSRDTINTQLRAALDAATQQWGVKVMRVELKNIDPPSGDQADDGEADDRRAGAPRDRSRRRKGEKSAAILRAEGQKQSQIVSAEGAEAVDHPRGRRAGAGAAARGGGRGAGHRDRRRRRSARPGTPPST